MKFKSLKGFRDFLPEEMAARREVLRRIEEVAQRFGFREVDLPSLERMKLFEVKSGEELVDQTYSFEDKGGRKVTLIPEQTPSRARVLAVEKSLNQPMKWYSTSKRWRYEQTQRGRLREFYQTDVDIFGADSVEADAEIIAVLAETMRELGVGNVVEILINDRNLMEKVLDKEDIENKRNVMEVIDEREKLSRAEFFTELENAGIGEKKAKWIDEIVSINGPLDEKIDDLEELVSGEAEEELERMKELVEMLDSYGVLEVVSLDMSIVRGLDYYTGLVFEVFDKKGELRAICGGGRYDKLVELFGGKGVPAVGFAIGDAVIEELMKREGVWPEEELKTDVYVLPVSKDARKEATEIVKQLRKKNLKVETDLKNRNVSAQLNYANYIGAEKVIIVGKRDLKENKVTVKEMESGEERLISLDKVVEKVG